MSNTPLIGSNGSTIEVLSIIRMVGSIYCTYKIIKRSFVFCRGQGNACISVSMLNVCIVENEQLRPTKRVKSVIKVAYSSQLKSDGV